MLRSKLFWKLFVMYAALTIVSLVALTVHHLTHRARLLQNQNDHRLVELARVLQQDLQANWSSFDSATRQRQFTQLDSSMEARLFVVDPAGRVLVASQADYLLGAGELTADDIASYEKRSPVVHERDRSNGRKVRFSFLPIHHDGKTVAFVGVAERTADVDEEYAMHRRVSVLLSLMVMAVALIGTYIAVREIWKPLGLVTEAADQVAMGREVAPIEVQRGSELLPLARAFDRMNREIKTRERELRDAANVLSTVLGGMAEGVFAVDSDQRLLFANAASGRFLKFDPAVSKGKRIQDIVRYDVLRTVVRESWRIDPMWKRFLRSCNWRECRIVCWRSIRRDCLVDPVRELSLFCMILVSVVGSRRCACSLLPMCRMN